MRSTGPGPFEEPLDEPPPEGSGQAPVRDLRPAEPMGWRHPRRLRWIAPFAAILVATAIVFLLQATRGRPEQVDPEPIVPLVRVLAIDTESVELDVVAHGTVVPRTESDLVAEVRGRVLGVEPQFVAGGFVRRGDPLLQLDAREHELAVERARAAVALRRSEARLAEADAGRRRELSRRGAISSAELELYESRASVARASRDEARAALAQAELDLERTTMRAPFDGRVRTRDVDVGQFVNPGQKVGRLYAVDYAEVRLPIQTSDLAHLDIPADAAGADALDIPVTLSARLGGEELSWPARLVRTEGDIDVRTRMTHVVARVDDPFGVGETLPPVEPVDGADAIANAEPDGVIATASSESAAAESAAAEPVAADPELPEASRAPLPAGLFVRAEIQGRRVDDVTVLPLMALREENRVFVVGPDDRLEVRPVEVLRRGRSEVVIAGGLEPGERVIVSPLRVFSPRMQVRTATVDAP